MDIERKSNCQRQDRGSDCRGCEVAVEIARNVLSKPSVSQVESILEVTGKRCPVGFEFRHVGDLRDLIERGAEVIPLREVNGQSEANSEAPAEIAAAV